MGTCCLQQFLLIMSELGKVIRTYRAAVSRLTLRQRRVSFFLSGCIKNGAGAPQPIPQQGMSPEALRVLPPAHPAFVAGAGYVIPGKLVPKLYLASLSIRYAGN